MGNAVIPVANGLAIGGSSCTTAFASPLAVNLAILTGNQISFYTRHHPLATIDSSPEASAPTTWVQRASAWLSGMRNRAASHASGGAGSVVFASECQESFTLGDAGLVVAAGLVPTLLAYIGIRIFLNHRDRSARRKAEPYISSILQITKESDAIKRGKEIAELLRPVDGHPVDQYQMELAFRSDSIPHALAELSCLMFSKTNRVSSHIGNLLLEHLQTTLALHDNPREALTELVEMSIPFLERGYDGEPLTLIDAWMQSVDKIENPKGRFDLYMEGARYVYEAGFRVGLQPLMMRAVLTRAEVADSSVSDSMDQQILEMAEWMQGQMPADIGSQLDELNPRIAELNEKLMNDTISQAELEELGRLEEEGRSLMDAQAAAFYGIDPNGRE